ncbi:hypothetical protein C2E23DRAFT_799856 [Lenzites betulinus]|nr:hypothetical protein C2E23DRAFT_799856 [Lenzites betulinus]
MAIRGAYRCWLRLGPWEGATRWWCVEEELFVVAAFPLFSLFLWYLRRFCVWVCFSLLLSHMAGFVPRPCFCLSPLPIILSLPGRSEFLGPAPPGVLSLLLILVLGGLRPGCSSWFLGSQFPALSLLSHFCILRRHP